MKLYNKIVVFTINLINKIKLNWPILCIYIFFHVIFISNKFIAHHTLGLYWCVKEILFFLFFLIIYYVRKELFSIRILKSSFYLTLIVYIMYRCTYLFTDMTFTCVILHGLWMILMTFDIVPLDVIVDSNFIRNNMILRINPSESSSAAQSSNVDQDTTKDIIFANTTQFKKSTEGELKKIRDDARKIRTLALTLELNVKTSGLRPDVVNGEITAVPNTYEGSLASPEYKSSYVREYKSSYEKWMAIECPKGGEFGSVGARWEKLFDVINRSKLDPNKVKRGIVTTWEQHQSKFNEAKEEILDEARHTFSIINFGNSLWNEFWKKNE